jgi:RNA polymerase primary sigma factor
MADKGRLVRVPVHTLSTYQKVARTSRELNTKLGRPPTIEEICSSADLDEGKVKQLQDRVHMQIFSLDSKIDDEEDQRRFIELMPDDGNDSPSKCVGDLEVFAQVKEIWDELKPIEADVLRRRFGLADGNEETLVEIGESHNLSRERIRQIQEQALDKLRGELLRRKAM